jgi:hypothetical protein
VGSAATPTHHTHSPTTPNHTTQHHTKTTHPTPHHTTPRPHTHHTTPKPHTPPTHPQIANYLKSEGVGKGDGVTIYLPMVPELPATMLACARIGAVHSVVFAGFSAESLAGRVVDSEPKVVVTCTGVKRAAKAIELKHIVDEVGPPSPANAPPGPPPPAANVLRLLANLWPCCPSIPLPAQSLGCAVPPALPCPRCAAHAALPCPRCPR